MSAYSRGPPVGPGPDFNSHRPLPAVNSRLGTVPGPPAIVPAPAPAEPEVDREKTCPLLLRVFTKLGGHHRLEDYVVRGQEPQDETQIYTWMDASLSELTDLVKEVMPAARRPNARLDFAFVYPDRKGRNVMRQVGSTNSTRAGEDDNKTLRSLNFQTGDFLDVAIY